MVAKLDYISQITKNISQILEDSRLLNNLAQIRAKSIGATFNSTFNEDFVWKDASYLATYGAVLLENGSEKELQIGMVAIKRAAEIFEYLSKISEDFDKEYLCVLSALCYDISGFQANGYSMASSFNEYKLVPEENELFLKNSSERDISETNLVLEQTLLILQKRLPLAQKKLLERQPKSRFIKKLSFFLSSYYDCALRGRNLDLNKIGHDLYMLSFETNNHIINLFSLLLFVRGNQFLKRSIWLFANNTRPEQNHLLKRYAKIVANSFYNSFGVNKIQNRISRYELWNSQLQALQRGVVTNDESYVVQMPTSAGKTMIAEMAILNSWEKDLNLNAKILYIAPFRALVNQVENDLRATLGKLRISVSSLAGGYEYDIFDELLIEESNVLIVTPEKADMLLRTNINFFQNLKLLVVDEGHVVGEDSHRAYLFELLISKIRILQPNLKTLFISAVLEKTNAKQLARWLTTKDENLLTSPMDCEGEEWKPTRKIIGSFNWENNGGRITYKNVVVTPQKSKKPVNAFVHNIITQWKLTYKHPETKRKRSLKFPESFDNKSQSTALLGFQLSEKGPTLIFCSRPDWAIGVGKAFLKIFEFSDIKGDHLAKRFSFGRDSESYRISCEWYGEDHEISKCLYFGIGIHFGKLVKPLRQTIEKEYKAGILNILISTNTIGQGLNFPIKNLIFHSVEINPQIENYRAISVRDFWNVLGRAGRAGKETEGHIIFMTINNKDKILFSRYINESNLEPVESYFYSLLKKYYKNEILEEYFIKNIGLASETTILQLLCEEALGVSIAKIPEELSEKSLFKIQIDEDQNLHELKDKIQTIFKEKIDDITINIVDNEKRSLFAKTGLNIQLCNYLYQAIESSIEGIKKSLEDGDSSELTKLILNYLVDIDYSLIDHEEMNSLKNYQRENILEIFTMWTAGGTTSQLKTYWHSYIDQDTSGLNALIADGFEYLFPWISSSILDFMIKLSGLDKENINESIIAIPTYLKYGCNEKNACYLLAIGMRSRELAISIVRDFTFTNTKSVVKWLSSVSHSSLSSSGYDNFSIKEIFQLSDKFGSRLFNSFLNSQIRLEVFVSGIKFEESRKTLSNEIIKDFELRLERDYDNAFDYNAIFLKYNDQVLGYVPREEARFLASLLDIDEIEFSCVVTDVQESGEGWRNIQVLITSST